MECSFTALGLCPNNPLYPECPHSSSPKFSNPHSSLLWTECLCLPTPNSYVEILTPNVMVLGGEGFGRRLGHEGGALMNGISVLIKEPQESSQPFIHVRTQEDVIREPGSHLSLTRHQIW